ncbi:hypothetical protein [Bacillus xiapuensis]|uniref:hypothetical protein n=1 Tax=Bacillus xiapuensis TaxID=2014075 RepID=UPI000C23C116|nr:hypothetical protein [Bacillus xiapuensis]
MYELIIGLASAALLLFLFSFFQKDSYSKLEKEVEELSMQFLQETYQLKKKIKILEEELLMDDSFENSEAKTSTPLSQPSVNAILKNQVISLYNQGANLNSIAQQSSLSLEQVKKILKPYMNQARGGWHE